MIYEFKIRRVRRSKAADRLVQIASPENVAEAVRPYIRGEARECFFTVCIGSRNELIGIEKTAVGQLAEVAVQPREVFRTAILASAAGIILCHNHPSGDPSPSALDAELTVRFMQAGELLGIPVHDHVIVTEDRHYSFAHESRIIEVSFG
jgi:DNA repair protein RadC